MSPPTSLDSDGAACGVVVPAYREAGRIGAVVRDVLAYVPAVTVVDDGSPDATGAEAEAAGARVLRHPANRGKGAALRTGLRDALDRGMERVLVMDADGQHIAADIPGFLAAQQETRADAVIGNRMADPRGMPLVRRWTNRFMSWLLSRHMGQRVPDTQNGMRLFTRRAAAVILESTCDGFAAESESLLHLAEAGLHIGSAPCRVLYGSEKSKIRPVRDTIRFFAMLRRHRRAGKGTGGC